MNNDVFISYSHEDRKWLELLQKMLKPLLLNNPISVWDDTKIRSGENWKKEIEKALNAADAAILLVSPNFLASDFITRKEIPDLLESAKARGLKIFWVPLSACLWEETEIGNYQAAFSPSTPLDSLHDSAVNKALVTVCKEIKAALAPDPKPNQAQKTRHSLFEVADFTGKWARSDSPGNYFVMEQTGAAIVVEEYVNLAGVAIKQAWGRGTVQKSKAFWYFTMKFGGGGKGEMTISPDGQRVEGSMRFNNGHSIQFLAFRTS